jgi:sugar phosphate isomerase/epimerase
MSSPSYPISVQMYSLREEAKDGNHLAVIKKVADVGYTGVETAGFYGLSVREYRKVMDDHGLTISGHHGGIPTKAQVSEFVETQKILGTPYCISAWQPPENYSSVDNIKRMAETIEVARAALEKENVTLCMHNHDFEFQRLDGRIKLEILAQMCPKLHFQIDTYWAGNFGAEVPAKMVAQFKDKTPLLHIKDGPFEKSAPMVAAGKGKQDFPAVFKAANPNVLKWVVVELDACATDMMQAVTDSYTYLVGAGLASGNKPVKR